jgi:Ca2+-binding RTX toxin-like protein
MSFEGKNLTLEIDSPTFGASIMTPQIRTVSSSIFEIADTFPFAISSRLVPASFDYTSDSIIYTVLRTNGSFTTTSGFNGYIISDTNNNIADFASVTIASNNLNIPASRISFNENYVYVNVQGLQFNAGQGLTLDIGFKYFGTSGSDIVYGGKGGDLIQAGAGNDWVLGLDGNDTIFGDAGDFSVLDGGLGNDIIYGGFGNDYIIGGAGNDTMVGLGGIDSMYGGDGNDYMVAGDGSGSVIDGGAGANSLWGGFGNDYAVGGEGSDILAMFGGNDYIFGNAGNDGIFGGTGSDYIFGGAGNDFIYTDDFGSAFKDYLYVGPGTGVDTVADFTAGFGASDDVIVMVGTAARSFSAVMAAATQVGAYTVIPVSSTDQVYLYNVSMAQLSASNFIFI